MTSLTQGSCLAGAEVATPLAVPEPEAAGPKQQEQQEVAFSPSADEEAGAEEQAGGEEQAGKPLLMCMLGVVCLRE